MKKAIYKMFFGTLASLFFVVQLPVTLAQELATPVISQNLRKETIELQGKKVDLRILNPSEGKRIRHKISGDIYDGAVYLGSEDSINNFEEIDETLAISILEEKKSEQVTEALKNLILSNLTDSEKLMQAERMLAELKHQKQL